MTSRFGRDLSSISTRLRALCTALVLAMAVAACGAVQAGEQADVAPFDQVLVDLFGTSDTDAYLASAERDAAELVVECMEQAGFEFLIPPEQTPLASPDPASLTDAQEKGFGIVAAFRHQVEQTDIGGDPNLTYLSTLTNAEIERFFVTLDGVPPEPGQRQDEAGCNGWASDMAYGDWKRFFEVLPNYTVLGEERDTHPDWLAAREKWRMCMQSQGFDYAEPDAIRTDVVTRMRDTVAQAYPGGQVPLIEQDGRFMVDPAVDDLLDELIEFEQAAAVANVECTAPLADQFRSVEFSVQQEFVNRHRADIDALLAASS